MTDVKEKELVSTEYAEELDDDAPEYDDVDDIEDDDYLPPEVIPDRARKSRDEEDDEWDEEYDVYTRKPTYQLSEMQEKELHKALNDVQNALIYDDFDYFLKGNNFNSRIINKFEQNKPIVTLAVLNILNDFFDEDVVQFYDVSTKKLKPNKWMWFKRVFLNALEDADISLNKLFSKKGDLPEDIFIEERFWEDKSLKN